MSESEFRPKGPFPLYMKDFRQDTIGWSGAERYMYIELLDYLFHQGGYIEDQDASIAEVIGLNRARNWREKLEKLKCKLIETAEKPGFLTQQRVLDEVENAKQRSDLARKAGKASAQKRATDVQPERQRKSNTPSTSTSSKESTSVGSNARATRLPAEWTLPEEWKVWAESRGHDSPSLAAEKSGVGRAVISVISGVIPPGAKKTSVCPHSD